LGDARRLVARFVHHYNHVRLHGAIGYVAPADKLAGRERAIFAERDRKLHAARERRKARRHARGPIESASGQENSLLFNQFNSLSSTGPNSISG
jgi:hypothetical protein